jgi:isopenicillin N synthase-like dioxygenase
MGSIGESTSIQLPVIDISEFSPEVGKRVLDAATKYGFLYLNTKGTGFTEELVKREFEFSRQFFGLPEAEKAACHIDETNRGWTGMHGEILDPKAQRKGDFKEAFNIGEFRDGKPQQTMPQFLEGRLDELAEFERTCKQVCDRVLDLLGLGLEVEEPNFFSSRHTQPSGCTVRLLHYPAIPADVDYQPEVDVRAGAHSDYGSVTLLFQRPSQSGLEIRTPEDTWAPVAVIPEGYHSTTFPPVLVNIGDLLSYWSNGILKSTVHRVIFPKEARRGGEDRYSIAYFSHPGNEVELTPVPSKIVAAHQLQEGEAVGYGGGATKERALTAKEHLHSRLAATYDFRGAKAEGGA